ncbi:hypothetical protein AJ79_08703 [Helicocarpus griseus UAMH5409]|uniref:Leucine rich repeat protein n=1 Tax=Helicocarpus griseus UAMH5409 TaxID=1447875 RepID=A0A2B7WR71_9EURO|nr:hypothetical protein AJ79_08703 [Helicocarpus griseus UAMH5409]
MVKLNYTGRKVQGVKAGQAVSKDLKKRIPPGSGARAAARDPHVEIDLTGKELTDEGFAAFVDDLIKCIQYRDEEHPNGTVQLTELVLKGNALTVASMEKLGQVVALSIGSLAQLDISNNDISVASRSQRNDWQSFLECFQRCYLLKKVDFGSNPLGGAGFDVLSRVYAQSDLDFVEPLLQNTAVSADVDTVNTAFKTIDLDGEKENKKPVVYHTTGPQGMYARCLWKASESSCVIDALKVEGQDIEPMNNPTYASTRGLRSVPYLVFSDCCTTNACAFHLWTIILSHRQPEMLLQFLPPSKSVAPSELASAVNGIVDTPNEKLSALGKRLLDLGKESRIQNSNTDAEETQSQDQDKFDEDWEESQITKQRELRRKHNIEMERVKNRLLLDVLKTDGVGSSDIWDVAFRMMRVARALLLDDSTRPKVPTIDESNHKESYPAIEYPYATPFLPQSEGFMENFPTIQEALGTHGREHSREDSAPWGRQPLQSYSGNTAHRRTSNGRKESITSPRKQAAKTASKDDLGRFGLPMDIWRRIIADAMGASKILTVEQQMQVLRYASDWQAIKQELRIRGGTEYEQIWKILSSMGCLSYAHH